ncbi:MAG: hypothetical protein EAX95_04760 [Candidatus Thorarchaeota archaeon]|nr:hypothetical protein [Candidatus Thorarchaeota archaeon]
MSTYTAFRGKSVLLALSFILLFMVSSTASNNIEQFHFDPEAYPPLDTYMTSALGIEDYVDSNLSDVDSSPDTGTHSAFTNQQASPDSSFDTLQEENTAKPPSDTENDIDSNTSDVDGVSDIGTETTFGNAQGTTLDSNNMVLTEANEGPVAIQDFVVISGTTTFGLSQATVTISEGVDYTLESGQDSSTCFIRIANTLYMGMGSTSGGANQNHDRWAVRIQNPDNIATAITFERDATGADCRVTWEIIQYVGSSGGANEIVVRDVGTATTSGTTSYCDGVSISTISDSSDVVVFITGQFATTASRNDIQYALFTASLQGSGPYTPRFTRGVTMSSNDGVSYAVVEFTGSNWRPVQRLEITTESSTEWDISNYATAYTDVTITSEGGSNLLDYSKAFLVMQYRTDNDACGIDDAWDNIEIISNTQLRIRNSATLGNRWKVVWIVENTQSGIGQMQVEHLSWYDDTTSGSEERVFTQSITAVDQMNQTSLFFYVSMDGTGTAFPRGSIDYRLTAADTITLTESDNGQERLFSGNVIQWPYSLVNTPYKVNFEYQWSSADFDELNEEVCIYIRSHTGSENLTVSYWNSGWMPLGTISSTGWMNFTATGLGSPTYTLRFLGSSESVDASQDVWNVDLITLHTWTLLTYNYELDLEVQWTAAQFADSFEELCIYSGTLDDEGIRVDVWAGSSWTNILFDLNEASWTNVSVGTWLTGSTFTIRFRGDNETGDATQSSWQIDCALLHTWNNSVPVSAAQPFVSNIDDTSYLYGQYKQYQITVYFTDDDGYADIDYLELTLTSDNRLTEYWTVRFDEDTDVFNEQSDPSDYMVLDGASSTFSKSGTQLNVTFYITINWNHPDASNTDAMCEVFDSNPSSSQEYFEVDWDVETRLDMSTGPTLDDGSGTANRGDLDGSMTASGTITYLGSALHPSASEIDVWISAAEYGTHSGPWKATNYEDVGGTFSATVYADDVVGLDAFTFKAVEEGSGAGGSNLFSSSETANYISDRVQVQSYSTDDPRINVGATANLHVTLYYDYDDSFVVDGTATINGISATYSGLNGVWDFSDTEPLVQMNTYNTLVYSGGTHGITAESQNGQSLNQIWDQITVVSYSVLDDRVDVGTSVAIDVTLIYAYDSAAVTAGTITVNGTLATHQGSGVWRFTDAKATVQRVTYSFVATTDNNYGITAVNQNGKSQSVIWDQITVLSYSVLDNRVNLNDIVTVNVTLEYAYDNTAVVNGVVTINLVLAAHQGNGVWQISPSRSTVQGVIYNSVVCSGNTHGITDVNQNSQSQLVIWDQITVRSYSVSDGRTNINDNVNIDVTIEYEYDDTRVTNGVVSINGVLATPQGAGVWRITDSKPAVQLVTYNTVACSGNSEGISSVNQNGQSAQVVWDRITVRSYTVIDSRVDINAAVNIDVLLEYEYDDTPVLNGAVTINSIPATPQGGGIWRITDTKSSVQNVTYTTVACSGNTYLISNVDQNGKSAVVIWDQIVVRSYSVADPRVGINTAVAIDVALQYEYDDSTVTNGVVTINGISATHQGAGVWRISQTKSSVQKVTYNNVQCSGNTFGISEVSQNAQSQDIIWDQVTVRSYSVADNRVNLDDSVNINVTIEYEYDDSPVVDGTVTINGNPATPQGAGVWRITQSRSSVQGVTYNTVACSGNTEGISSVNQNGQSQLVIWDQITVRTYEVSDPRDNVGDTITVTVELEYEYDNSDVVDGFVTVNFVSFTYTGSLGKWSTNRVSGSVSAEIYNSVVVSDNEHGITDVNQNSQAQTIVWDRIQVLTTQTDDTRIDVGTFCEIRVTLRLEYDGTLLGAGDSVTLNGAAMTWDAVDARFELNRQKPTVGIWMFYVNSSLESTYGISALNLNSQSVSVIWDQIAVRGYSVADNRVNLDDSVNIDVTIEYEYDDSAVTDGSVTINGVVASDIGSGVWRITQSRSSVQGVTFDSVACSGNTPGITNVNQNGQSQLVIWDQLSINIVADMDSVENSVQVNFTVTVTFQYDSVECATYTIRIARNATYWNTFTNANITSFIESNIAVTYNYTTSLVVSESTYGITEFTTNTETVTWGGGTAAPVNDAPPTLTNPDNTDFMYARLRYYVITSNVSDAQGYANIVYIELSLWDNTRSIEVWRVRFTEDTNAFSVQFGADNITLAAWSSYVKNGNDIDIIWVIKIEWDHAALSNVDIRQYVIDEDAESDENWYESNWDVETRLAYSVSPYLSDNRGDINTNDLVMTGTVVYYGSLLNPLANETDIWVLHDESSTWSGDVNGIGAFSISGIASSASVRLNTYTVKIVVDGAGSGGSDLFYTASATDTFITDQIEFYLSGAEDGRINVNDTGTVWWNARYDYDNVEITTGLTSSLNGSKSLLWDATNGRWYFSESVMFVSSVGYSVLSASESGYGLTGWSQTASNATIIWDLIVVRYYSVADNRVNVTDSVDIDVLLEFEFDDSYVVGGSVLINSLSATYQGSGLWRISESRSTVLSVIYDFVSCSGNAHNITLVNQNAQTQTVIWDRVLVSSYAVVDDHVNVGASVNIDVTLVFEYDSFSVTSGTVTINGVTAAHQGGGVWRIAQTRGSAQGVTFDTVECFGNAHGISSINQNSQSQLVIWDEIVVASYSVLDDRVNVGDNVAIDVLLNYGYDGSPVIDGIASINTIPASHQGSGVWRISQTRSSVQSVNYSSVTASGNANGITSVDQNGQSIEVVWDQIIVQSYTVIDRRVNLNDLVIINVTLLYEYDGSDLDDGVVVIQSISASHIAGGIWQITVSESTVQSITYDTIVCSGNSMGISSVNTNSQQQTVIWDQITVRYYTVTDSRVNVDDSVNIDVTLQYEYDDSPVTNGVVAINEVSAIHQGAGVWRITEFRSSVQGVTFDTVACSGNAEGISSVDQNGQSQTVIWDRIIVRSYAVLDNRVNVNAAVAIDVTIEYEFDSTDVATGTVMVNGTSATYRGAGVWRITVSEPTVRANLYNSVTCSGNNHGITSVNQNGQSQLVIWDRVVVRSITASDDRDDVGSTITVLITLQYEYDDTNVTNGLVIVNSVLFSHTAVDGVWSADRFQTSVTHETYDSAVVSGNTHGISVVNQNGASQTIIWDRIRVLTTTVDDSRLSIGDMARIMVTAELEYDNHQLGFGDSLFLDNSAMTWDGANGWFYYDATQSSVGIWSYYVNASGAAESTYGISVVTTMGLSQDVIWDRLLITITPDSPSVIDFTDVSFTLSVTFDYDDSICTTYVMDVSRNGTYWKSFSNLNASFFIDNNAALTYQYTVQTVSTETAFAITAFTCNTAEVTWTTPLNFAPFNNGAPILLNPDDTDSMFSRLRYYYIRSSVVDYDGASDINYLELALLDNSRTIEIWRVRFVLATQTFSIIVGSQYISLAGSTYFELGYQLNVTWSIKIDWAHFDMVNVDTRQYVVDSLAVTDTDFFESNWDIETRLDYSSAPSLSDDHGNVNTNNLQATGSVVYYGSLVSPLANETDVWVIHDFSGTWTGDVDILGDFTIANIGSSASVRLNTYTFKIVIAGAGPVASDLFYTTSRTDTFITDRIEFYLSGVDDPRININTDGIVWWNARYQYGGVEIQSNLIAFLNGTKLLSWDAGSSRWSYQESRASSRKVGYTIAGATDSRFGITVWVLNAPDQSIIWDSLIVSITSPTDQRINLNENATGICVSAIYSYDSTPFDGTIFLNNTLFHYSTVTRQYYTASSAIGGIHGISVISSNDIVWCIWDRVEVVSIFANATYLDPGEYVILQMFLRYDFDDAPIISGNFSLSYADFYQVADGLWEANATRLAYQTVVYNTLTTCFASSYGITSFSMYGHARTVYWDRLEFYQSSAADSRIDVSSTGFSLWSVRLENAGIDITSGISALVTGPTTMTYVDGFWRASHSSDIVGDETFTILSASLGGIDFFIISASDVTIIWDRIQVLTTSASSTTPIVEEFIIISATLSYEYDGTPVTDGVVTLWDLDSQISMSYNATGGFWFANITKVVEGVYTFYIEAVSGNQFGITQLSLAGNQITVEFVPPPLPRLTPMMIAGISGGVFAIVAVIAVLARRRYYVAVPPEVKQINAILDAMEKEEKIEEIDVKTAEQSFLDLLEPGLLELGLTLDEILSFSAEADLERIQVIEPDMEMVEALEEFELPEPEEEEEEVIVREIPETESTGEFEELDIEAYTDIEAASEEALALMLEEVRRVKETSGVKVPLTKDDWVEKLPSSVKSMFFEEELRELDIPDIEQLAKLSPEEVEDLLKSIEGAQKTDAIYVEDSYVEIVNALKMKFDEIEEAEELDEVARKKRLIRILPSFVIDHFKERWLENLSIDELTELTQLTEAELKTIIDSLAAAKEAKAPLEATAAKNIDFDEELKRLDLGKAAFEDEEVEGLDEAEEEEQPTVKEIDVHEVDEKDDRSADEEVGALDLEDEIEEPTREAPEIDKIDFEGDLEWLDHGEATIEDEVAEDLHEVDEEQQPSVEETEDFKVDEKNEDSIAEDEMDELDLEDNAEDSTIEESEIEEPKAKEMRKIEEEPKDHDAEKEPPEFEDDDDLTDWYQ